MPHPEWCHENCTSCTSQCELDERIPCSPDCEGLNSTTGEPASNDCLTCDAVVTRPNTCPYKMCLCISCSGDINLFGTKACFENGRVGCLITDCPFCGGAFIPDINFGVKCNSCGYAREIQCMTKETEGCSECPGLPSSECHAGQDAEDKLRHYQLKKQWNI